MSMKRSRTVNIAANHRLISWSATFHCCQMCWLLVYIYTYPLYLVANQKQMNNERTNNLHMKPNRPKADQLYHRNIKQMICVNNKSSKAVNLTSNVCTRLDDNTPSRPTTAIFAVLNSFMIKRLSTKSRDDESDLPSGFQTIWVDYGCICCLIIVNPRFRSTLFICKKIPSQFLLVIIVICKLIISMMLIYHCLDKLRPHYINEWTWQTRRVGLSYCKLRYTIMI